MELYEKEQFSRVIVKSMHEYKKRSIRWLEEGRIAMGKLTLIAGDPGLGKSFLTLELCARVSRGECGSSDPQALPRALILSAEDHAGDTIKPRLDSMCANMSRVHIIEGAVMANTNRCDQIQLDRDIDILYDAIDELTGVTLIVIDPISAYMGRADSHNNAEVRSVLAQLAQLAEVTGAAVVCVTHLNKDSGNKRAVYRAMGSLAFTAAARTVHLVTKHPGKGELDPHKRVVSMVKNNIGKPMPSRVYVIENDILTWLDDELDINPDMLDAGQDTKRPLIEQEHHIDKATNLLNEQLSCGQKLASKIIALANSMNISKSTLNEAKKELCVISRKVGKQWYWSLPPRPGEFEHHQAPNPSPDALFAYGHQGYL